MANGQWSMANADTFVFHIDSQEKFSQMNTMLTKAIAEGETDIVMDIAKGVYYFNESHLRRRNENHPDVSVRVEGHGAVLIAAGNDYRNGDPYQATFNPHAAFIDMESLTAFDFWDYCRYAEGMAEVADEEKKLCRLPVPTQASSSPLLRGGAEGGILYINIPQWFYSRTYKVEKAEDGYLYFTVPDLKFVEREDRRSINVNYDYLFGGQDIRYRLCNPANGNDFHKCSMVNGQWSTENVIHECRVNCFLNCHRASFKTFTLSGLRFLGNSDGNFLIKADSLVTEGFNINNCHFEAIKHNVLWANHTPNITFSHNSVDNCYNGLHATNSCVNTSVTENTFSNMGGNMMQTFCANCKGKDYYIAHNKFLNFGYSAMCLGVWYGQEKPYESSGIVEYNEIWLDPDYIAHKERYTLQDTGGIYLCSRDGNVTVRYNYIHDIDGMLLNRGIFCDDGANHFRVYGNVVVNILNSYSIESRNCEKKFPGANEDNRMEANIVDCPIKFEGSSVGAGPVSARDNGCVVSGNVMLYKEGEEPPENIYSRLTTERPDQQMTFHGNSLEGIIIDRRQMERLRKLPHAENAIKAAKWRYK